VAVALDVARNLLSDWRRREVVERSARDRLGIASVGYDDEAIDELLAKLDAESCTTSWAPRSASFRSSNARP